MRLSSYFSDEQLKLLNKFGFHVTESLVIHKKMGIEKDASDFLPYVSLDDLQEYIKEVLRTS